MDYIQYNTNYRPHFVIPAVIVMYTICIPADFYKNFKLKFIRKFKQD